MNQAIPFPKAMLPRSLACRSIIGRALAAFLLVAFHSASVDAQQNDEIRTGQPSAAAASQGERAQNATPASPAMDRMADSLRSMADMCTAMMEREMKGHSLKVALLVMVALLATAALALFVVLEVYWIRYWHRRLRTSEPSSPTGSRA